MHSVMKSNFSRSFVFNGRVDADKILVYAQCEGFLSKKKYFSVLMQIRYLFIEW